MLDVTQKHRRSDQALVGVSMESAPNYLLLADEEFLSRFDLLATLVPPNNEEDEEEQKTRVPSVASAVSDIAGADENKFSKRIWNNDDMFRRCCEAAGNPAEAVSTAAGESTATTASSKSVSPSPPSLHPSYRRENAIAYVNSNCAAMTDRDELVKTMADVLRPPGVPLRSFVRCKQQAQRHPRRLENRNAATVQVLRRCCEFGGPA